MLRIMVLPLVLFTLSMACMGQTFQYSRGWTNGKRATNSLTNGHFHRDDENLVEVLDPQNYDHKIEKCLQYLQRYMPNFMLHHSADFSSSLPLNNNRKKQNNDNNNLFVNHHQSQDLFDDLNGATAIDTGEYAKH